MTGTHTHHHRAEHSHHAVAASTHRNPGYWHLAIIATAHCLLGCGTGEIAGMLIGMQLGLSNTATIVLAVALGFVFGLGLGVLPLLRAGFSARNALISRMGSSGLEWQLLLAQGTLLRYPSIT